MASSIKAITSFLSTVYPKWETLLPIVSSYAASPIDHFTALPPLKKALVAVTIVWYFIMVWFSLWGSYTAFTRYRRPYQKIQDSLNTPPSTTSCKYNNNNNKSSNVPSSNSNNKSSVQKSTSTSSNKKQQNQQLSSTTTTQDSLPPVSIIRPLKGVDVRLYHNLECSFLIDYPCFEIVFCVANMHDPAVKVVQELMVKYPNVDARLAVGAVNLYPNHKVNNLLTGYGLSRYECIWICDSNVQHGRQVLREAVVPFSNPRIGLVHHLPVGIFPESFGSLLEQTFLNTVHAKMYLSINWLSIGSCCVGKSNLLRKRDIERVGGLAYFGNFLSEDNTLGQAIFDAGFRHDMVKDLAFQPLGSTLVMDYFDRRVRWSRIRKCAVPHAWTLEPFSESFTISAIAGSAFSTIFPETIPNPLYFMLAHLTVLFCLDLMMFMHFHDGREWSWSPLKFLHIPLFQSGGSTSTSSSKSSPRSIKTRSSTAAVPSSTPTMSSSNPAATIVSQEFFSTPRRLYLDQIILFFIAWFVREITAVPLFLYAAAGNTVEWRGVKYLLRMGGRVEILPSTNSTASAPSSPSKKSTSATSSPVKSSSTLEKSGNGKPQHHAPLTDSKNSAYSSPIGASNATSTSPAATRRKTFPRSKSTSSNSPSQGADVPLVIYSSDGEDGKNTLIEKTVERTSLIPKSEKKIVLGSKVLLASSTINTTTQKFVDAEESNLDTEDSNSKSPSLSSLDTSSIIKEHTKTDSAIDDVSSEIGLGRLRGGKVRRVVV